MEFCKARAVFYRVRLVVLKNRNPSVRTGGGQMLHLGRYWGGNQNMDRCSTILTQSTVVPLSHTPAEKQ